MTPPPTPSRRRGPLLALVVLLAGIVTAAAALDEVRRDLHVPAGYGRSDPSGSPVKVPPDAVFLLGDNAASSEDSRRWGPLPVGQLRGRVLWVFR